MSTYVVRPRRRQSPLARSLAPFVSAAILLMLAGSGALAGNASGDLSLQLAVNPATASQGSSIAVAGTGFAANSRGALLFDNLQVAAYHAGGKGTFSMRVTVPSSAAAGSHGMSARNATGAAIATAPLTVVPASASPGPTSTPAPTATPGATPRPTTSPTSPPTSTSTPAPTPTPAPTATATTSPPPTPAPSAAPGGFGASDGGVCDGRFSITQGGATLALPYCSNRSLSAPSSAVKRAIVVVHGDSRNAPDHLRYVTAAASQAGITDALVVAPQFLVATDLTSTSLRSSMLYWTSSGWKQGDKSSSTTYARPWSTSSFAVMDGLLAAIANRQTFPNLTEIVVVGHSAGGQLADRYMASTGQESSIAAAGIRLRFVVANPSSYLYFSPARLHPASGAFSTLTTAERQACSSYDTFKYGLSGLNAYAGAVGASTLTSRYGARQVTYLLGALDIDPADASLDTGCEAEWQGPQRLQRGLTHFEHLGSVFGQGVYSTHRLATVAGVGHDAKGIYASIEGRAALFGAP